MSAGALARRLAAGERIGERVALVVAHPDDEVLALGALLARFDDLLLIHLTDGAPEDMRDARRAGWNVRTDYAGIRRFELYEALLRIGARAIQLEYGVVDQQAAVRLPWIARRLGRDLAGAAAVMTHAYEGAHPDHDSAALAVARACAAMGAAAPARLEFAGYHGGDDGRVRFGTFQCGDPGQGIPLTHAERLATIAARDEFKTQAWIIAGWLPDPVRLRDAPEYDFTRPPPGGVLYDGYGWWMTGERWRRLVACV